MFGEQQGIGLRQDVYTGAETNLASYSSDGGQRDKRIDEVCIGRGWHFPAGAVGIFRRVIIRHHRVLERPDRFESDVLSLPGEGQHTRVVGNAHVDRD